MKSTNPDDYRKGLDYVRDLTLFNRENAPDKVAEAMVLRTVYKLQHLYGSSDRVKRSQIVAFMRENCGNTTKPEIEAHFKWKQPVVHRLFESMVSDGVIESYKSQSAGSGPRGGRPATRYRLKS